MLRKTLAMPGLFGAALLLVACAWQAGEPPRMDAGVRVEAPVFVKEVTVEVLESYPMQVVLRVAGELPTPCHELEWKVERHEAERRVEVKLFSVMDPGVICIQVLERFDVRIPLGDFSEYGYRVYLNGQAAGDF